MVSADESTQGWCGKILGLRNRVENIFSNSLSQERMIKYNRLPATVDHVTCFSRT